MRKGTRLPYLTHPANVAIILTRYGRDDHTVVAGILHDVIEDCVREGYTREMLEQRIGDKFGRRRARHRARGDAIAGSMTTASSCRTTIVATTISRGLATASDAARWVCAADKLHNASSILADLRRTIDPNSVWSRFTGGKGGNRPLVPSRLRPAEGGRLQRRDHGRARAVVSARGVDNDAVPTL